MAEKMKFRFKGHESFILREGWLNKGLFEIENNPKVFSENYGADALGVGPNMAKAIRYWMKCAGLTEEIQKAGTKLTPLGQVILKCDPYLENNFTIWLLHCRIASNRELATAWYLFFNHFSYEEFNKNQMTDEMRDLAISYTEGAKFSEKSLEDDCDAILHMYIRKKEQGSNPEEKNVSPFWKLGLLKQSGEVYELKQPDFNKVPEEIILFLLLDLLKQQKSIQIDDLLTMPNGPGRLLNIKRSSLLELLEELEKKEKIILNRTAGLNMVYLQTNSSQIELVQDYYREESGA